MVAFEALRPFATHADIEIRTNANEQVNFRDLVTSDFRSNTAASHTPGSAPLKMPFPVVHRNGLLSKKHLFNFNGWTKIRRQPSSATPEQGLGGERAVLEYPGHGCKPLVKPTIPYLIVDTLSEAQVQQLHSLYQEEWWTAGRSLADIRTMLQYSDFTFGVVTADSQELVGFTRVLTDRVYKALLFDVIVHSKHRGAGLGSFLLTHILQHPVLSGVRHIELYCLPERREFYRRHGFTAALGELQLMRRVNESK